MPESQVCLACPKEYWIAFALESQGVEPVDGRVFARESHSFHPVMGTLDDGRSLSLVSGILWLDAQESHLNDAHIEYFICPDLDAAVVLTAGLEYLKVLP
jgi:hypothetical protein